MDRSKIKEGILTCLQNTGILLDSYTPDTKLRDVIGDSLALVTFEIELEQSLGLQIPAEQFTIDWMDSTFEELEERIKECS